MIILGMIKIAQNGAHFQHSDIKRPNHQTSSTPSLNRKTPVFFSLPVPAAGMGESGMLKWKWVAILRIL